MADIDDVMNKLEDVLDKIADNLEKINEVKAAVNAERSVQKLCIHCGGTGVSGDGDCPGCSGSGVTPNARITLRSEE